MSTQHRFTVDTPHGRFNTNNPKSYRALVFKNRSGSDKPDVLWLATDVMADFQVKRLERLGFYILGRYETTENVDTLMHRVRARQAREQLALAEQQAEQQGE
jgi:hypothetical protein